MGEIFGENENTVKADAKIKNPVKEAKTTYLFFTYISLAMGFSSRDMAVQTQKYDKSKPCRPKTH